MRHIVVIADSRYPICEPFAGGMQALTWHLARGLRARGLEVSVFAAPGSDPRLGSTPLFARPLQLSAAARQDISMQPQDWLAQHHAYLRLMLDLGSRSDVDIVHNNSLHHLPVAMSEITSAPMITTLHSPPTPWLESAVQLTAEGAGRYVAVSGHTAAQWHHVADVGVVANGVDTGLWRPGPGGETLIWSGRIVPEKGPHLAIDIARAAGRPLRLAGPVVDSDYWQRQMLPRMCGRDDVHYLGHLHQRHLARVVAHSAACLVTPLWDEPYGLVAAEAMSCGTPVVGFARGGLPEVVDEVSARLVEGHDVAAASQAVEEAVRLPRRAVREHAEQHCSVEVMVERYLELYSQMTLGVAA